MAPKSNIIRRLKAKYSVKIKGRRKRSVSLFCKTFAPALFASNDSLSLPLNTSELNCSSASYSGYNDSSTIDKSSTSTGLKILKKEVRAIFNEKYSEAVKKNNQRLPYSKVDELGISMLGLPLGVFFKNPAGYGARKCKGIISCRNQLKVVINRSAPKSEKDMLEVVVLEG